MAIAAVKQKVMERENEHNLLHNKESLVVRAMAAAAQESKNKRFYRATKGADEILETIKDVHARADGYTLDPHSAIGVAAARRVRPAGSTVPMVCLACAHWAKFPDANRMALGAEAAAALQVPEPLASLDTLPTRVKMLPYDVATVQAFIVEKVEGAAAAK